MSGPEEKLHAALDAAQEFRGDVTITRHTDHEPVVGFLYDHNSAVIRLLPADGGPRMTILIADIVAIEHTGRDAALGKSFETWVRTYVQNHPPPEKQ